MLYHNCYSFYNQIQNNIIYFPFLKKINYQ
uniref:Uncharacterized protein n=1 Tax=Heterorhabditis bacteriophora TaxID=37862 RepID=A0A1I7WAA3_HETBA